jgi:signal peptidase I
METTLHGCTGCNNDKVLVDKLSYRFSQPARGDIVVFSRPRNWTNSELTPSPPPANAMSRALSSAGGLLGIQRPDEMDLIKRVIAVGGQTVSCCDARNRVMVDGKPLDEPYIYFSPEFGPAQQSPFGPIRVPDGQLWVMGDSRNNSVDSRASGNGPVPLSDVIGKARLIVLPLARAGLLTAGASH